MPFYLLFFGFLLPFISLLFPIPVHIVSLLPDRQYAGWRQWLSTRTPARKRRKAPNKIIEHKDLLRPNEKERLALCGQHNMHACNAGRARPTPILMVVVTTPQGNCRPSSFLILSTVDCRISEGCAQEGKGQRAFCIRPVLLPFHLVFHSFM